MITFQLASGLALYFVITNVVGIVQQYFVSGLGGLAPLLGGRFGAGQKAKATRRKGKGNGKK
jgi:hypothetical protein